MAARRSFCYVRRAPVPMTPAQHLAARLAAVRPEWREEIEDFIEYEEERLGRPLGFDETLRAVALAEAVLR